MAAHRPRKVRSISLLVALAAGFLALAAPRAGASIGCGSSITTTTTLDHDLINCTGTGLSIGADNLTLDLGGHLVDGVSGSDCSPFQDGIHVTSHHNVTVRNGVIRQFCDGVEMDGVSHDNVLKNLELDGNGHNIRLSGATSNTIKANVITGGNNGILLTGASDGNLVTKNNVTLIRDTAIRVNNSSFNTVKDNSLSWGEHNGIYVLGSSASNLVQGNKIQQMTEDGIQVTSTTTATSVEKNNSKRNADDGIDVAASDANTTITKNTADENGDYGMIVNAATTDGLGNKAKHNGQAAQCSGVTCT